jgi:uncharacterized protein (UPF0332 family)
MENKSLKGCFKIKDGLKIVEPTDILSKSYLEQARAALLKSEKDVQDNDCLWATVALYYADYYALYSFLQKVGLKCENHTCTIIASSFLLGEDRVKIINQHKDKRTDAQYYLKIDQESKVREMIQESKIFVAELDNLISNLSDHEINEFRRKIKDAIK